MARQESQSKLLYYPTPASVVGLIATWLSKSGNAGLTRLVDPCAGTGAALRQLADTLSTNEKVETWGIELSYARAAQAAQVLDTVLPTSFYAAAWGPRSASLIFNNPPYDWSDTTDEKGRKVRHEVLFATKCTPKLAAGGVQVLIVPQRLLADEALARHWTGWYERSLLMRFPDGEFEAFGQVVLFGIVREGYVPPTKVQVEGFQSYGQEDVDLPQLVAGDGRYQLPVAPAVARFSYTPFDDESLVQAAAPTNLLASPEWQRATYVRPSGAPINPLVQLKIGHLSMLISAGELGIVRLALPDGPVLVKGTLTKTITRSEEGVVNSDGELTGVRVEERERLESVITLLHGNGQRERLSGTQQVADFITVQAGPLADAVLARNTPFYDWQPTRKEWDIARKTGLGLPPLPGRRDRGLFDVQKHFAIASARRMRVARHVLLNCEMGFGKTATAIGTLEQRGRWPALVMCPGHMVEKWRRDLVAASDPAAPIAARIITKPARAEASWLASKVQPVLAEYGAAIALDERWQVPPEGENDNGLRRRLTISVSGEHRRYLADRLTRVLTVQGRGPNRSFRPSIRTTLDGLVVECVDRDDYTLADFFADLDAGRLGHKAVAIVAFEPAKYDAGLAPIELPRRWLKVWDERHGESVLARVPCCPGCGQPFGVTQDGGRWVAAGRLVPAGRYVDLRAAVPNVCPHSHSEPILGDDGKLVFQNGAPLLAQRPCNTRLYSLSRWRRVGLSRLVQRQYKHRFQVYVADEIHEGAPRSCTH